MDRELRLYWTSVEFKLKESHKDFKKVKGGMVYCFVQCFDSEDALYKFKSELDKHELIPFDFEFINPYEEIEWEKEEEQLHFQKLVDLAKKTTSVVLDDFYMYENY